MLALVANNTITKCPIGLGDLQQLHPDTSFTLPLKAEDLTEFGVVEVKTTEPPVVDHRTQRIAPADPKLVDGHWTQQWAVETLSTEEQELLTAGHAAGIRADRNTRLAACDWTQLPDAPVDAAAWAAYRQDLRDVTAQAGFPWEVTWPAEPA